MRPWRHVPVELAVALLLVAAVATFVLLVSAPLPSAAPREDRLQRDIAACRALGGAPHLNWVGDRYVRECWLEAK